MTMTAIMFAADDEDVVESSVRHNLNYVDALFVVGVDSRDGTRRIVESLSAEGLPVAFSPARDDATRRIFATAALGQLAGQETVRHVVLLGADTFLEGPPEALKEALLARPDSVHLLPRRLRAPTEADDWQEADPYRRLVHARLVEMDERHVAILPHAAFASACVRPDCLFSAQEFPDASPVPGLAAVQLPVRNACQFPALVAARVRELAVDSEAGLPDRRERVRYWMRMGAAVRDRSLLAASALREAAASFEADDPAPLAEDRPAPFPGHALRYPVDSAAALDRTNALIEGIRAPVSAPA